VTFERSVAERLEQLEQLFSTYRPESALSRFNATPTTEWIPVAAELVHVADDSRRISELTTGAFDVTVLPLVQLWGFGSMRRTDSIPTQMEISAARARVDWRRLETRMNPPALRKTEASLAVDFSSMAKGFSADEISRLLAGLGAPNHLVQVGGDVKAAGTGVEGKGWRVAIENPSDLSTPTEVVTLRDMALSTSGDARNFFVLEGRRYGHIIDPRRGEPASSSVVSVSVLDPSCATSSALATALFVLGDDEGFRFAAAQQLAGLLLVRAGKTITPRPTPRFEALRK
jgi:thiamine biosynthesis lipoprotein